VEEYTRQQLSFQSDIFPALQGLAKTLQGSSKPRYLAGLWEDTLIFDLMWTASGTHERPGKWRAPSWSWAAVVGSVSMYGIKSSAVAEVMYVETVPRGTDPFGELQCGLLEIKGNAIGAQLTVLNADNADVSNPGYLPQRYRFDIPQPLTDNSLETTIFMHAVDDRWPEGVTYNADYKWWADQDVQYPKVFVYIVRMVVEDQKLSPRQLFLVLRCIDDELLLFERLGILACSKVRKNRDSPPWEDTPKTVLEFEQAFGRAKQEMTFMIL
jgi:hypothetical protein